MGRSEVSTSVVKWSEGLNNRVSIILKEVFCFYRCFVHHILSFFGFYCLLLYIWLYVLYASV